MTRRVKMAAAQNVSPGDFLDGNQRRVTHVIIPVIGRLQQRGKCGRRFFADLSQGLGRNLTHQVIRILREHGGEIWNRGGSGDANSP